MDRQILFILLLISPSLFGQNPTSRNHSLPPPHSKDPIDQILQAKNGILYVSSLERLYAYDSHAFELINVSSELSPQITCLHEGPDFNIWIGREDGTVVYYNPSLDSLIVMPVFQTANQSSVSGILINETGLWIATRGNGLFLIRNKITFHLDQKYLGSNTDIYTMTKTKDDRVWIGHDGGMQAVDFMPDKQSGTFQVSPSVFPGQIVTAIASGSDSILWLGFFDNGIGRYNIHSKESSIPLSTWQAGPVRSLVTWGEHEVWIGSAYEGLWRYDIVRNQLRMHDCEYGRKEKRINDLLTDREGNIWVSSAKEGLVSIFRPIEWIGGPSMETQAVLEDNSGSVWAGTTNGLFRMRQDKSCGLTWSSEPVCLAGVPIISLEETADSLIWIGTFGDGLFTYNRFTNTLSECLKDEKRLNKNILSIRSNGAELWLTTLGGVAKLKWPSKLGKEDVFFYSKEQGIPAKFIYDSYADSQGNKWFATDGMGLIKLPPGGKGERIILSDGDSTYNVYAITSDHHGHLWFSTQTKGLYQYDGKKLVRMDTRKSFPDMTIASLISTNDHRILAIHENGLLIFSGDKHIWHRLEEGLFTSNWEPHLNAVWKNSLGQIWIGSDKGLMRFTAEPNGHTPVPQLVIHEARTHDGIAFPHDAKLSAWQNFIFFRFAGVWFTNPDQVVYRYQLEGYDRDWISTSNHQVIYSHLPAGTYTFKLQVSANGNFGDAAEIKYAFSIARPFYRQVWFIILVGLTLLGGILILLKFRDERLAKLALLKRRQTELALEVLKSQINPHFLFNSFNSLQGIIEKDPKEAVIFVEELSDFYRTVLTYREKDIIPLIEELEVVKNYLKLLRRRFGEAIQFQIDLPEPQGYIIPLTLQILVENAAKHNTATLSRPLHIHITAGEDDTLIVQNNLQPKMTGEVSTGTGLSNLKSQYLFLTHREMVVTQDEQYFTVVIPLLKTV